MNCPEFPKSWGVTTLLFAIQPADYGVMIFFVILFGSAWYQHYREEAEYRRECIHERCARCGKGLRLRDPFVRSGGQGAVYCLDCRDNLDIESEGECGHGGMDAGTGKG